MTKLPGASGERADVGQANLPENAFSSALMLAPEPPFPAVGGGPLRSASIFTYLARHFALDVITFQQPGSPDPRDAFPSGVARSIRVIQLPRHSKSGPARIARNLKRAVRGRPPLLDRFSGLEREIGAAIANQHYEVGIIEHFWCAPYAAQLRPACAMLMLDLHNIESAWHSTLAGSEGPTARLLHRRFAANYRILERLWLPRFDHLLVTSAADAIRAGRPSIVYPNAIPLTPKPQKAERHEIIFTGNLEYQPNITAILHFRNRIWPDLRKHWPGLIWTLAGKNPTAVQGLLQGDERIHLTGPIDDAVKRIAQAQVAIVPLLAGSGTRIKIIEAWAAATPVVSTSIGAEGLDYKPGEHLILADSPAEFSRAISALLTSQPERTRVGEAGRRLYERRYTWEQSWVALDSALGNS